LKEEALDRTLWRTRFGRGYGPVVRQTIEWMLCGDLVVFVLHCYTGSSKLRQRVADM
jgi:hypothetical protein